MSRFTIDKKTIKYLPINAVNVAYTADLLLDGKKVGTIENKGDGGDTVARLPEVDNLLLLDDEAQIAVPDSCEPTSDYLEKLMDIAEKVAA